MNDTLSIYLNLDAEKKRENEMLIRRIDELLLTVGMKYSGIMNMYIPEDMKNALSQSVMEAFACQINGHASVSIHPIVLVVNLSDLRLYHRFLGIVIRLPVFPVVIVSIRANIQPTQQPAQPKIFLIFSTNR